MDAILRAAPRALLRALPKSESSKTLVASGANKVGLSLALDGTLREGAHDMRVFGLGFLRSVASKEDYVHFTTGMNHYYGAMERSLDANHHLAGDLWRKFPELRRTELIKRDLVDIGAITADGRASGPGHQADLFVSPATQGYIKAIERAGSEEDGSRLLGHLYVRYFADLFGGRALGYPTMLAVPELTSKPNFYSWAPSVEADRRSYIEKVYEALNEAGAQMVDDAQRERVVQEARDAFEHNANVYTELPGLNIGAAKGAANIVVGAFQSMASVQ